MFFFSEITQHNLNKPWIGLPKLDYEKNNVGNDDDSDSGAENETLGPVQLGKKGFHLVPPCIDCTKAAGGTLNSSSDRS